MENKKVILLALLDLSTSFDTVDHTILLKRLYHSIGISGQALKWFTSYLSDRSQVVSVNGVKSSSHLLECCVPQGSVLGPSLYSRYTKPIGNIFRESDIQFHLFADDCQPYVSLDPAYTTSHIESLTHLENCIAELSNWMFQNKLKLNDDKPEFLVIGSGVQKAKIYSKSITVGGHAIKSATSARNLGVWIDEPVCPWYIRSNKSANLHTSKFTTSLGYTPFYPTALKGCRGIVFTHGVRMGWRAGVLSGGRWEKVCPGCISETVRCRKLILSRDIG